MMVSVELAILIAVVCGLFSTAAGLIAYFYAFPFTAKAFGKLKRTFLNKMDMRRRQKNVEKLWRILLGHHPKMTGFYPTIKTHDSQSAGMVKMISNYQENLESKLRKLAIEFDTQCATQERFSRIIPSWASNRRVVVKERDKIKRNLADAKRNYWSMIEAANDAGFDVRKKGTQVIKNHKDFLRIDDYEIIINNVEYNLLPWTGEEVLLMRLNN